ncbi:voltage-dependent calcium channel gamma-7 subunit-like isoform X1 [Octopus vulgaris]|uniref:Voltage-dependent calcium channel gamma-7 subunit-like isoform X1 n=1 Tax=Octopus vulgaris TaxID=6645 RepID=A0AA36B694_OCTVU|nr:voltage-dependent calcium channel gamma-7 subunit-like isoform X1 [Octopus vulgaris]
MGSKRRRLSLLTLTLASMTVVTLSISLSTDFWIYVKEPLVIDPKTEMVVEYRFSRMGLWRKCSLGQNKTAYCQRIVNREKHVVGRLNKTVGDLVAESVNSTCAFAVVSLVLVVFSAIIGLLSNVRYDSYILLSSILFVISGLTLVAGLIMFISAVNDEVSHLPAANQQHPTITYSFAWSFFLAAFSFFLAEGTGVAGIYLFFRRNSSLDDMIQIIPGLEEKIPPEQRKPKNVGYPNFNIIS